MLFIAFDSARFCECMFDGSFLYVTYVVVVVVAAGGGGIGRSTLGRRMRKFFQLMSPVARNKDLRRLIILI